MTSTSNAAIGFDTVGENPVSMRVVEQVADVTETDPIDLEPIYNVIDPDHLDRLFETADGAVGDLGAEVRFQMEGCDVVVGADGSVDVTPVSEAANAEISPTTGVETQTDKKGSSD